MTPQRRIALIVWVIASLLGTNASRAQTPAKAPAPAPVTDQMASIPYFTVRDGMSSILTLNNNAPSPTPVTVTIYNMEGKAQVLVPFTMSPHSFKQIELKDVIASDEFSAGNLAISYKGFPMELGCQVSISNLEKRISFESREWGMIDMMEMMSSSLE